MTFVIDLYRNPETTIQRIRQYRYGVFLYEIYLDEAKKQGYCDALPILFLYCNTIFFLTVFCIKKIIKICIPCHLKNALYRTLSSMKQKFQKGAWPKCFIQYIVQYHSLSRVVVPATLHNTLSTLITQDFCKIYLELF